MGTWPGCCCVDDGLVPNYFRCPCDELPTTLFLSFSRHISGVYEDATLVRGPAPTGWEEFVVANTDPGVFFPSQAEMWWSTETFSVTYYTTFPATATKTFKYCFACYRDSPGATPNFIQRVWRYNNDGTNFGSLEWYVSRAFGSSTLTTEGPSTIACDPYTHARTFTASNWAYNDGGVERAILWNGTSPPNTLLSSINCVLSG